ncbi:putative phage capsid protein [Streptomyces scabiei 87.22]|uniref:Putative phage capsid protein n=1 Tax=Streptomyces scabiei (strain 87.22) TaxID=680198 RepID=C9ZDV1_STRSW|nr:phage major capsid protein [Streptomyces scabiei]MDX2892497.1 phage major capsid protein [Streptomyces scabiei]MDX2900590.1 phage major capsid protein [Streptomyces scabiei]MDX2994122.1 phage major capsid protein [Streptomyces scabiei]MDX3084764.1 phage major capsid protein [Streptomyces scabiei]MDX3137892.1 phage major capsid protein [Streptomyces scabiei]
MPQLQLSHGQAVIRLREIRARLEELEQRDNLTAEDERDFDELTTEFAEVDDHRRQLERRSALERVRAATQATDRTPPALGIERGTPTGRGGSYDLDPVLNPDSVEDRRFRNPWDLGEMRTFNRSPEDLGQELRARALCAVEKMAGANDRIRSAATDIIEAWDDKRGTISRMCLATSSPEYMRAWSKLARGKGHMVTPEEQQALERAMSLTDSAGGYLVPFQLDPTIIITANGSINQIRQVARQVVATGDIWNGVSSGSVSWRWAAEASEASDNAPTLAQPTVPVYKADGFVPISIEAMDDAENVTTEVGRLLAFGKDTLEAAALATGSGSGQPTGIVTALTGTSSIVTSTTTDTFASGDVYKVDTALPGRYRPNAAWLANRGIYNAVRQFDSSGGTNLWERIGADVPPMLLGRKALESEDMDGVVTAAAENYVMVYGDFDNYVIADRIGMSIEFLPHLVGANRRPTGQRGWYAWYRVGADSVNDGAFRMLNVT